MGLFELWDVQSDIYQRIYRPTRYVLDAMERLAITPSDANSGSKGADLTESVLSSLFDSVNKASFMEMLSIIRREGLGTFLDHVVLSMRNETEAEKLEVQAADQYVIQPITHITDEVFRYIHAYHDTFQASQRRKDFATHLSPLAYNIARAAADIMNTMLTPAEQEPKLSQPESMASLAARKEAARSALEAQAAVEAAEEIRLSSEFEASQPLRAGMELPKTKRVTVAQIDRRTAELLAESEEAEPITRRIVGEYPLGLQFLSLFKIGPGTLNSPLREAILDMTEQLLEVSYTPEADEDSQSYIMSEQEMKTVVEAYHSLSVQFTIPVREAILKGWDKQIHRLEYATPAEKIEYAAAIAARNSVFQVAHLPELMASAFQQYFNDPDGDTSRAKMTATLKQAGEWVVGLQKLMDNWGLAQAYTEDDHEEFADFIDRKTTELTKRRRAFLIQANSELRPRASVPSKVASRQLKGKLAETLEAEMAKSISITPVAQGGTLSGQAAQQVEEASTSKASTSITPPPSDTQLQATATARLLAAAMLGKQATPAPPKRGSRSASQVRAL